MCVSPLSASRSVIRCQDATIEYCTNRISLPPAQHDAACGLAARGAKPQAAIGILGGATTPQTHFTFMLHIEQVPSALAVCLPSQCEQASAPAAVLEPLALDVPLIELSLSSISPSALQPTAMNITPLRITTNSLLMTLLWVRDVCRSVTRFTNRRQPEKFGTGEQIDERPCEPTRIPAFDRIRCRGRGNDRRRG